MSIRPLHTSHLSDTADMATMASPQHLSVAVPPQKPSIPGKLDDEDILLDEPCLSRFERWIAQLSPLKTFQTKHYFVSLPYLPIHLTGLRIVQLSDLQCYEYAPADYWKHVIQAVYQLDPDIIVVTGDLIHFGNRYVKQTQDVLNYLPKQKSDGSPVIRIACMGNHDYMDRETPQGKFDPEDGQFVLELLKHANFQVLIDQAICVLKDPIIQQGLWISALDDYEHIAMSQHKSLEISFANTLNSVQPEQAHIMLSHNPHPDIVAKAVSYGNKAPGLILSGHTHGGQISCKIPGIQQLMDILRRKVVYGPFSNQYLQGAYAVQNSCVYVNAGTGSSIRAFNRNCLPVRIGSMPEISVFHLAPSQNAVTHLIGI